MNGLKPVSEGATSTIIFRESSEKRSNIVQPERQSQVALSSSDLLSRRESLSAYISTRFSIASVEEEICRERGRCRNLRPTLLMPGLRSRLPLMLDLSIRGMSFRRISR